MKKYIVLLICLLIGTCNHIAAQQLKTKPNAKLYYFYDRRDAPFERIVFKPLPDFQPLELPKSKKVLYLYPVCSTPNTLYYDSYVVIYQGKRYFIYSNDIENNERLEIENHKMDSLHILYESDLAILSKKIEDENMRIEKELERQKIESTDKINELKIKIEKYNKELDSLHRIDSIESANKIAAQISLQSNKKLKEFHERVTITTHWVSRPNTAGGCDVEIKCVNNFSKAIKYIWWSGKIYNAVDDFVLCEARNKSTFSGKITGPCEPQSSCGGIWNNIIYNSSARYLIITNFSIEYMDGSKYDVTLTKNDWKILDDALDDKYKLTTIEGQINAGIKESHYKNLYEQIKSVEDRISSLSNPTKKQSSTLKQLYKNKEIIEAHYTKLIKTGYYKPFYNNQNTLF